MSDGRETGPKAGLQTAQSSEPKTEILKGEEALLLDHDYDGIQELDHPLPNWWLWLFYVTIAFSAWYVGYYMSGIGPTLRQELAVAMTEIEANKPQQTADGGLTDDALLAMAADPSKVQAGKDVFAGKCAACHGDHGQGLIGPNLTDDYWLHGTGTPAAIATVVRDGVPDKGMPPWGSILTPDELANVTVFIKSIHGSNPAGAKEPQGTLQAAK